MNPKRTCINKAMKGHVVLAKISEAGKVQKLNLGSFDRLNIELHPTSIHKLGDNSVIGVSSGFGLPAKKKAPKIVKIPKQ